MRWIAAFFVLVLSSGGSAQGVASNETTVFGMTLGKPLAIKECTARHIGSTVIYDPPTDTACFEFLEQGKQGSGRLPPVATVYIKFPIAASPELAKGGSILVGVIDSAVQSIGFNTLGVQTKDRDLATLRQKFGAPAAVAQPTVTNGFGAEFQSLLATWLLSDGTRVYFNATEDGMSTGLVRIETERSARDREATLQKIKAMHTQL